MKISLKFKENPENPQKENPHPFEENPRKSLQGDPRGPDLRLIHCYTNKTNKLTQTLRHTKFGTFIVQRLYEVYDRTQNICMRYPVGIYWIEFP